MNIVEKLRLMQTDHIPERHKSPGRRLRRVRWTAGLCVKW